MKWHFQQLFSFSLKCLCRSHLKRGEISELSVFCFFVYQDNPYITSFSLAELSYPELTNTDMFNSKWQFVNYSLVLRYIWTLEIKMHHEWTGRSGWRPIFWNEASWAHSNMVLFRYNITNVTTNTTQNLYNFKYSYWNKVRLQYHH